MLLDEIFGTECEIVYVDDKGNELVDESAIRQFKLVGGQIAKRFRCLAGPKAGKLVKSPADCGVRKDPKKVRQGKRVMQQKGSIIQRKAAISKRKAPSKRVAKLNQQLSKK